MSKKKFYECDDDSLVVIETQHGVYPIGEWGFIGFARSLDTAISTLKNKRWANDCRVVDQYRNVLYPLEIPPEILQAAKTIFNPKPDFAIAIFASKCHGDSVRTSIVPEPETRVQNYPPRNTIHKTEFISTLRRYGRITTPLSYADMAYCEAANTLIFGKYSLSPETSLSNPY
jgi:hypothetical protein